MSNIKEILFQARNRISLNTCLTTTEKLPDSQAFGTGLQKKPSCAKLKIINLARRGLQHLPIRRTAQLNVYLAMRGFQ